MDKHIVPCVIALMELYPFLTLNHFIVHMIFIAMTLSPNVGSTVGLSGLLLGCCWAAAGLGVSVRHLQGVHLSALLMVVKVVMASPAAVLPPCW